eukprot:RCo013645
MSNNPSTGAPLQNHLEGGNHSASCSSSACAPLADPTGPSYGTMAGAGRVPRPVPIHGGEIERRTSSSGVLAKLSTLITVDDGEDIITPAVVTKRYFASLVRHAGPAFVVSVAYIDPGNFATNIGAGSIFSYHLLWVILWCNVVAIFLQSLSAKLGIATGNNLPQMCAQRFSYPTNCLLWAVASAAAMATDLAEFLGAVLGFYLLFGIPMITAAVLTGVLTFGLVALKVQGQRVVEAIVGILVGIVTVSYLLELWLARPDWGQVALHTAVPMLPQPRAASAKLAVGMLGATVMPHVIFLHSELVQHRRGPFDSSHTLRHHYRMEKANIMVAMNVA